MIKSKSTVIWTELHGRGLLIRLKYISKSKGLPVLLRTPTSNRINGIRDHYCTFHVPVLTAGINLMEFFLAKTQPQHSRFLRFNGCSSLRSCFCIALHDDLERFLGILLRRRGLHVAVIFLNQFNPG